MKIQKDKYGSRRPKLEVGDLDGDAQVATIATVEEITVEDEEGKRVSLVLAFEETGDKSLWLNQTQIGYLVEQLGTESDSWIGQLVPIEKHTSTFRGKQFPKLWIAVPERWNAILGEAGVKPKSRRAVTQGKSKKTQGKKRTR